LRVAPWLHVLLEECYECPCETKQCPRPEYEESVVILSLRKNGRSSEVNAVRNQDGAYSRFKKVATLKKGGNTDHGR
jgi:hypothetical protein